MRHFLATLVVFLLVGANASALTLVSQSAILNAPTQEVQFTLEYNQPPDFQSVDAYGRQVNSFQYYIFYNNNPFTAADAPTTNALIQGWPVHYAGSFAVCDGGHGSPDTGWGPLRGYVPYQLTGSTVTFTVPMATVGAPDGSFGYRLRTWGYAGSGEQVAYGQVPPDSPQPSIIGGPITYGTNGHSYYLLSESTWSAAELFAEQHGWHLVTIDNASENAWVHSKFSNYGGVSTRFWIGLYNNGGVEVGAGWRQRQSGTQYWNISSLPDTTNPMGFMDPVTAKWAGYPDLSTFSDGTPMYAVMETPEPSTFALLVAGALSLIGYRRLRLRGRR
jgi:hypothetical protein